MSLSALDLFTIGVGPSSSHTVGPMRAACQFVSRLKKSGLAPKVARLRCDLYGSLAATGKGHGTDGAVLMGFLGEEPETVDVDAMPARIEEIRRTKQITTPWGATLPFEEKHDLDFKRLKPLPLHPNGMHFMALDDSDAVISEEIYYSLGGGFIATEAEMKQPSAVETELPMPFTNAVELMQLCETTDLPVSGVVRA